MMNVNKQCHLVQLMDKIVLQEELVKKLKVKQDVLLQLMVHYVLGFKPQQIHIVLIEVVKLLQYF
jgi:hypothetical protein